MSLSLWENHFKPEIRNSGNTFIAKDKVHLSQITDTQIQAYIKASTSIKVSLTSESIESDTIFANCNCPSSKRGQLCKHIWAVLATVVKKQLDFLESKTDIQKVATSALDTATKTKTTPSASQEAYKQKQADYRKAQYQKQKERAKNFKAAKKKVDRTESFPLQVVEALRYFADNGFTLNDSLDRETVLAAKKKLSNIFHPDKGGSHDEILELNSYSEVLLDYTNK